MLSPEVIRRVLADETLFGRVAPCDHPTLPAALPDVALDFLIALAREAGARTAFEFGSGQSTLALLKAGIEVTSLEHSRHWMSETEARVGQWQRRHTAIVRPLETVWRGSVPFLDWRLDRPLAERLRSADMILIDSPPFPPFRESTLISALEESVNSFVILDDVRIPTLRRFCDRIARANAGLLHRRVEVGHTYDVFVRVDASPLDFSRPVLEAVKGWRRYVLGRRAIAKEMPQPASP